MPVEASGRFGYLRDPLFLACAGLYVINREWVKPHLHHYSSFWNGHLNDCLFVPAILPVFLLFYRLIRLRPDDAPPRWWEVAAHIAVWVVFFEWFGPMFFHRGTSDWGDALCYAAGGAMAWLLWHARRPAIVMRARLKELSR